jgi:hypothetical protein
VRKSSETVPWRGSKEEIRDASCPAASVIDCDCTRGARISPNDSANATRSIGHIIARYEPYNELQKKEGQHQTASEAER